MQSSLYHNTKSESEHLPPSMPHTLISKSLFPQRQSWLGPVTRARLMRSLSVYGVLYLIAIILAVGPFGDRAMAFASGLLLPGGGFLSTFDMGKILLFIGIISIFMSAIALWFATGNVILAPLIWIGSAFLATTLHGQDVFSPNIFHVMFFVGPLIVFISLVGFFFNHILGVKRREKLNTSIAFAPVLKSCENNNTNDADELGLEEIKSLRLLLDRALQPVDEFEGFEWLDQFQTAAVRYQINFISYALSLTQSLYLPACHAQFNEAQDRLKSKQEDYRIWGYWGLENLWGNFKIDNDPIACDNIMYSGFVAAQLAYARNAGNSNSDPLQCKKAGQVKHSYELEDMVEVLRQQFKTASYGLLPCEPNWIYPLCNMITASAIRAQDSVMGTTHWDGLAPRFRHYLETEFMTPSGKFVPFKSSYTGLDAPQIGGAVMQSFPCFFLNAILPDLAERQWMALQLDMKGKSWVSALWPVDVGNYRFSRASSFGATALAARELGDDDTANLLLQYFDDACPRDEQAGIVHHKNASLWAHANMFMARIGKNNMLRNLVTQADIQSRTRPHISTAIYPDLLIAKAVEKEGMLDIVLYPGAEKTSQSVTVSGLLPNTDYKMTGTFHKNFISDPCGNATLTLSISGRSALKIYPKE